MRKFKKILSVVACATGMLAVPMQSNAGGGGFGGATEITQLLNNTQLVMEYGESVKHTYELARQSYMDAQQLWHDIQNIEQIGKNIVQGQLNNIKKEWTALTHINKLSTNLHGGLERMLTDITQRQIEAFKSGLSIEKYVAQQQRLVDNNNKTAELRIENERRMIEGIKSDYDQINEWAAQIPNNVGIQQSLGLMNNQTNKIVQQLARVSELLVQQNDNVGKADELGRKNEEMIRNAQFMKEHRDRNAKYDEQMKALRVQGETAAKK